MSFPVSLLGLGLNVADTYIARGDRRGAPLRIVTVEPLHLQFLQEGSPEFNDVPPFDRFGPRAHQLQGDELNQWTNWFESDVNVGRGGAAQQPPSNASTQFPIERAGGRRNITSAEQARLCFLRQSMF